MKEKTLDILQKYSQEHLLHFINELNEEEKNLLEEQILSIDFEQLQSVNKGNIKKISENIEPITGCTKKEFSTQEQDQITKRGEEIIKKEKYALVTLAGGQGTRLGHTGPKGTYKVDLKNCSKYIFEIFVEYLNEIYKKYSVYVPWYIMTSKENNEETTTFFADNDYFGYPKEKITFFEQGQLPLTDLDENILLKEKNIIYEAADGNGGIFTALSKNGIIEDMKKKDIEWVLITGIDNILVNVADPFYIGLVEKEGKLNGVKSIAKNSPEEKVGVFCKRDGKPGVVEYSEMDDAMRYATKPDGELQYIEANIVNHLLNIKVLEKIQNEKLPIHKAIKKIDYIDKNGNKIAPTQPCVIKYETFIFDYFNKVDDVTILRVERTQEFAPIKNKLGPDSPDTASKLYNDKYFKGV